MKCETCGTVLEYYGPKLCDNCWEVETRLSKYLKSPKALDVLRDKMPRLDDWVNGEPDAWDYEAVLKENDVKLIYTSNPVCEWTLYWRHGFIGVQARDETRAKRAAALFISLWLRGVSASFADKLMGGYLMFLEYQENGQA
jgi:hypothetical protein